MLSPAEFLSIDPVALGKIIWIDILLSGDNAVVIALACRGLPPERRRVGILLGAGAAVGLRILFALLITTMLAIPYLKLVGGVLLVWIGVKLARGEEEGAHAVGETADLWKAVRTIAIADAVMSLDNVLAIAAAADGHVLLFVIGLLLTIPLIVFGSTLILGLLTRFPLLVWFGAALLGWIAGGMIVEDPALLPYLPTAVPAASARLAAEVAGAGVVLLLGWALRRRAGGDALHEPPAAG